MTFKPVRKVYKLSFDGTEYEGLEVSIRSLNNGELMKLIKLALSVDATKKDLKTSDVEAVSELFASFAKKLVSWNVVDEDDQPVAADQEGVDSQEFDFVMAVILNWIEAVSGVGADLGKVSNSGGTSQGLSLPMEAL